MSVDESGLGDREGRPNKRFKIMGILRDALRHFPFGASAERARQRDVGAGQREAWSLFY
jgi:hypothetical protein